MQQDSSNKTHTPLAHSVQQKNQKPQKQPPASSRPTPESEPARSVSSEKNSHVEVGVVREQTVPKDVAPHVEVRPDTPEISADVEKQVKDSSHTQFPAYQTVKLPLKQDAIPGAMKQPLYESIRWLGTLSYYIMAQTKYRFTQTHENVLQFMKRIVSREFGKFPE